MTMSKIKQMKIGMNTTIPRKRKITVTIDLTSTTTKKQKIRVGLTIGWIGSTISTMLTG